MQNLSEMKTLQMSIYFSPINRMVVVAEYMKLILLGKMIIKNLKIKLLFLQTQILLEMKYVVKC